MELFNSQMSRRDFLKQSATTTAGLVVAFHLKLIDDSFADLTYFVPNAWLRIAPTGEITFILNKSEMGQGVYTTLTMVIAEELGADPAAMTIQQAPANRVYINPINSIQITGGSTSVSQTFDTLRKAGATARMMLVAAACERWKITIDQCDVKNGKIWKKGTSEGFSFGQLATDAARIKPPEKVTLKSPEQFEIIGQDFLERLDNRMKVTGKATFGIDVQIPNMLTAVVIRCPQIGSKVKSFKYDAAKAVPGVSAVVQIPTGIAVVAEKYWQAKKARELVEIEWQPHSEFSKLESDVIFEQFKLRASESGKSLLKNGDLDQALSSATTKVEAEYVLPYLAHATLEPCNFTADVKSDSVHLYGPTQSPGIAQQIACEITGLSYEKVFVETTFLGGGFGRRLQQDYVAEAVYLSKSIGKPVKIIWSREEDMQNSMYRPANFHVMKGGLGTDGELTAWSHKMVGPSILAQIASDYARTSFPQWIPGWAKSFGGWAGSKSFALLSNDPTAMEGADNLAYAIPHVKVSYVQDDPGVPLGFWRSVGHSYTAFAVESFIDELAIKAKQDPYQFRRKYLTTHSALRNKGVLDLAAQMANWSGPKRKGVGRGIAQHLSFGSYVAYVVDVKLNTDNEIIVDRVVAAVDCGLVVNPDGARAQIESAVNFGLSAILKGEITIKEGAVEQSSFDTYEVLRFLEAPKNIEIHFVQNDFPPTGLGEPGVPPLAPAIANAVFALTGKRLRKMPLKLV